MWIDLTVGKSLLKKIFNSFQVARNRGTDPVHLESTFKNQWAWQALPKYAHYRMTAHGSNALSGQSIDEHTTMENLTICMN